MSGFEAFNEAFKKQMQDRGVTDILDPEHMAQIAANSCASNLNESSDQLPIFSLTGLIIPNDEIDHEFETLDENHGEY